VRSAFEEKLLQQYSMSEKKIALVRGTENAKEIQIMKNIAVWNTADTETLTQLFSQSEKIICRSGYSSLMDLHAIQRKAVLVPTPGQTEQEYLAKHWKENFGFEVLKLGV
jgi:UDP-N-acetylglucosamine:LPS N-acetylglucosamine transferase